MDFHHEKSFFSSIDNSTVALKFRQMVLNAEVLLTTNRWQRILPQFTSEQYDSKFPINLASICMVTLILSKAKLHILLKLSTFFPVWQTAVWWKSIIKHRCSISVVDMKIEFFLLMVELEQLANTQFL